MTRRVSRGGLKSQRAEAVPIHAYALLDDPIANQARGDGREQNSTAEVSSRDEQTIEIGRAEDGKAIGRVGPQAFVSFFNERVRRPPHSSVWRNNRH